jgi:uncharacterized protein with NRDE domain
MCLIAWRWLPDSPTPLTWAANRDEFAHRPTGALRPWSVQTNHTVQHIMSGIDLAIEAVNTVHGTWAGVNAAGKFAWLTNIRSPQFANPHAPSRGLLVSQYLANDMTPQDYMALVQNKAHRYNGFNLVVGQISGRKQNVATTHTQVSLLPSNAEQGIAPYASCLHFNSASGVVKTLAPGVYGLSNADLDTPWPKTRNLVQAVSLNAAAQFSNTLNTAALFTALGNPQRCSGDDLPSTGVPIEIEHVLSSAFIADNIRGNDYGTRSSTVGWVHGNAFEIHERSFNAQGLCNNIAIETLKITPHAQG